ncbi:MAG: metal-dependent transcriptional regulator [Chloroflexi bacterium]|nr:metal-dependent transcriptional regulator [Chloroflexota bacterium]MCL5108879.1 metal-dependent transcriptional regulator [Chloroflexota bacterium]
MSVSGLAPLSQAEEEYVESIYKLTRNGRHARTEEIASAVGVSAAAASGMLKRLAGRGVVRYERYGGAELSEPGERAALGVIRRHRLTERLLTDILKIPWDSVHEQACRLEHAVLPQMEEGIEGALADATTCPHGNPIPNRDGALTEQAACPLSDVDNGHKARIVRIVHETAEFLHYLSSLGLLPQVEVEVESKAPFSGPIIVRVGDAHYALGREVAAAIMVAPA